MWFCGIVILHVMEWLCYWEDDMYNLFCLTVSILKIRNSCKDWCKTYCSGIWMAHDISTNCSDNTLHSTEYQGIFLKSARHRMSPEKMTQFHAKHNRNTVTKHNKTTCCCKFQTRPPNWPVQVLNMSSCLVCLQIHSNLKLMLCICLEMY